MEPLTEQEWAAVLAWAQIEFDCADLGEEARLHKHMGNLVLRALRQGRIDAEALERMAKWLAYKLNEHDRAPADNSPDETPGDLMARGRAYAAAALDEVKEQLPQFFEGPPIDITGGADAADYIEEQREGDERP